MAWIDEYAKQLGRAVDKQIMDACMFGSAAVQIKPDFTADQIRYKAQERYSMGWVDPRIHPDYEYECHTDCYRDRITGERITKESLYERKVGGLPMNRSNWQKMIADDLNKEFKEAYRTYDDSVDALRYQMDTLRHENNRRNAELNRYGGRQAGKSAAMANTLQTANETSRQAIDYANRCMNESAMMSESSLEKALLGMKRAVDDRGVMIKPDAAQRALLAKGGLKLAPTSDGSGNLRWVKPTLPISAGGTGVSFNTKVPDGIAKIVVASRKPRITTDGLLERPQEKLSWLARLRRRLLG